MFACIHALISIVNLKFKWLSHVLNNRKLVAPIFSSMFWNYSKWWHLLHQKITNFIDASRNNRPRTPKLDDASSESKYVNSLCIDKNIPFFSQKCVKCLVIFVSFLIYIYIFFFFRMCQWWYWQRGVTFTVCQQSLAIFFPIQLRKVRIWNLTGV